MSETEPTVAVFAYGSNLCVPRIAARVERVAAIAVGTVRGYELRFNKKSRDGSAKANAHRTGCVDDRVWGVVYSLSVADKRRLDRFEGLGREYFETEVEIESRDATIIRAWLYRANSERIVTDLSPYDWYHRFCVEGARHHGLPQDYIDALASVRAVADPDVDRHERELSVLNTIR